VNLLSGWPRCPLHDAWMQPSLKPRQWQCNVLNKCSKTEKYRWWRSIDRNVFAYLSVAGCYYCPVCESLWGHGVIAPQDKLCRRCSQMGIEQHLQFADCGKCGRNVEFFGFAQLILGIQPQTAYCRKCMKFLCGQCVFDHACAAEEPATLS
jgi:hypothetical protein